MNDLRCTVWLSGVTFKDHLDPVAHRASSVGGVAVVDTRLGHGERGIRSAQLSVGAPGPHDMGRGVSVSLTHQIFGVTVEHRDCTWKFGVVDGGLIC